MTNTYAPAEITGKQMAFLTRLLDEADAMLARKVELTQTAETVAQQATRQMRLRMDDMTKVEASKAIGTAMDNNALLRQELEALGADVRPVRERHTFVDQPGMYRVGDRIFKVLPSRSSNRHYAKELTGFHWEDRLPVSDTEGADLKFVIARGAMALIKAEHRMPLDMEKAFGQLVGACVACGKLLTKPESIAYGKGPVCSDNYTR